VSLSPALFDFPQPKNAKPATGGKQPGHISQAAACAATVHKKLCPAGLPLPLGGRAETVPWYPWGRCGWGVQLPCGVPRQLPLEGRAEPVCPCTPGVSVLGFLCLGCAASLRCSAATACCTRTSPRWSAPTTHATASATSRGRDPWGSAVSPRNCLPLQGLFLTHLHAQTYTLRPHMLVLMLVYAHGPRSCLQKLASLSCLSMRQASGATE